MRRIQKIKKNILKIFGLIQHRFIWPSNVINGLRITDSSIGGVINVCWRAYVSVKFWPKYAAQVRLQARFLPKFPRTTILIQGPIGENLNFFLNTLEIYRVFFQEQPVGMILVLWEGELDESVVDLIKTYGVHVVTVPQPDIVGLFNVNLQTFGCNQGLRLARSLGFEYVVKTRPDCRLYDPDFIVKLHNLSENFPVFHEPVKGSYAPNGRIIASSIASCFFRVYGLTDILMFGTIEELSLYFDPEPYETWLEEHGVNKKNPLMNGTPVVSEIFLCARYLNNLGLELDWSADQWMECLRRYFCIVDQEMIDFLWKKYNWQYLDRFKRGYSSKSGRMVTFADWLGIYSGNKIAPLDLRESWEMVDDEIRQSRVI